MQYKGSCHCGKVAYTVEGDLVQALECNCSHCSRKGYLLWFVPRDSVSFSSGEDAMSIYRFNRHAIDHKFCPNCGCAPFGFGADSKGNPTAAVNIRCLEGVDLAQVERVPVDGRSF
jgi:hypothetical protein